VADIDEVAKKILKSTKKYKPAKMPRSKVNPDLPPGRNAAMKAQAQKAASSTSTEKAVAKSQAKKTDSGRASNNSKKRPIAAGVPGGGAKEKPFNFKKPSVEEPVFKAPKKGGGALKKALKTGGIGGALLAPIAIVMNALDADDAGDKDADDMAGAEAAQRAKTTAKIKADKAAQRSSQASTKKASPRTRRGRPQRAEKTEAKAIPSPRGRSDAEINKGFQDQLKKNFGTNDEDGDLDKLVRDVMLDEMDKGGLKRTSPRIPYKKPVRIKTKHKFSRD
jgi:hypothetical protein